MGVGRRGGGRGGYCNMGDFFLPSPKTPFTKWKGGKGNPLPPLPFKLSHGAFISFVRSFIYSFIRTYLLTNMKLQIPFLIVLHLHLYLLSHSLALTLSFAHSVRHPHCYLRSIKLIN